MHCGQATGETQNDNVTNPIQQGVIKKTSTVHAATGEDAKRNNCSLTEHCRLNMTGQFSTFINGSQTSDLSEESTISQAHNVSDIIRI